MVFQKGKTIQPLRKKYFNVQSGPPKESTVRKYVAGGGEGPVGPELSIRRRAGRIMPVPQEVGEPIAGLGGRWEEAKKFFRFK